MVFNATRPRRLSVGQVTQKEIKYQDVLSLLSTSFYQHWPKPSSKPLLATGARSINKIHSYQKMHMHACAFSFTCTHGCRWTCTHMMNTFRECDKKMLIFETKLTF